MSTVGGSRGLGGRWSRLGGAVHDEGGYVMILVMIVLLVIGMMAATLLVEVQANQQHVLRDRAYTQSLAVAEAGLNQYLWMVFGGISTEQNNFIVPGGTGTDPHDKTFELRDVFDSSLRGNYTITVAPPTASDARIRVTATGQAAQPAEAPRTVSAHIGRPAFSEYVLLVDEDVYIGGPSDRIWHGKTHSNTGIRIETENITDPVTCSQATYTYGSTAKPGIWSQDLPSGSTSKLLWWPNSVIPHAPAQPIDFNTVTSDFARLNTLATGQNNLAQVTTGTVRGYYIKLLPNNQWQWAYVSNETESRSNPNGGTLTYGRNGSHNDAQFGSALPYPTNGVIFVKDNVWIQGTNVSGRITVASTGQLNSPQTTASIHIIGDLTYAAKDGSVAIGLIAQNNIEIPMYAPYQRTLPLSTQDMEIDCALIAQQGAEFVNSDASGSSSSWGPRRDMLTIYGSVSSLQTPYRAHVASSGGDYSGFEEGTNTYDSHLLHQPPPYFPKVGSYQILDWRELPQG